MLQNLIANWPLVAGAAIAIAAIYMPWGSIIAWARTPSTKTKSTTGGSVPTRRDVLDYLDAAYTFFENAKCKEGMAAVNTAVNHAFHEHDEQGNVTEGTK